MFETLILTALFFPGRVSFTRKDGKTELALIPLWWALLVPKIDQFIESRRPTLPEPEPFREPANCPF